ncbi:MAG TPA: hypothetical protein VGW40_04215 [Allosphingosinicella sp.]|nr:hypothetical protein [Allosphingosinicella sp.]
MSTSADFDGEGPRLIVNGDLDAELYVIGNDLRTAAYGVGSIDQRLAAGIYKLRAVRGGASKEQLIEVTGDLVEIRLKIEKFAAIAPIAPIFGDKVPAIEGFAQKLLAAARMWPRAGKSPAMPWSRLMVLGHSTAGSEADDPLACMRIFPWRNIASRRSLAAGARAKRIGDEMWRGSAILCRPGTYILDFHDGIQWVRQAVLVAPGWDTRIFMRRGSADMPGAPPEVSIQMARPDAPVVYDDRYQTVEVARRALELNRPILVKDHFIDNLLEGKWSNPIMGLTGLHLFLEAIERSEADPSASQKRRVDMSGSRIQHGREIVREVIGNLHKLLRGGGARHPSEVPDSDLTEPVPADLAALETRAGRFLDAPPVPRPALDHPPMFWASWVALRDAPADVARYDVQQRLWSETAHSIAAGPYFSWQARRVSLSGYVLAAREMAAALPPAAASGAMPAAAPMEKASRAADAAALDVPLDPIEAEGIGRALGIPSTLTRFI